MCRHFRTQKTSDWKWMSAGKFNEWIASNESALPLKCQNDGSSDKDLEICVSSDLPRAVATAKMCVSNIRIEYNSDLAEVPFTPFHSAFFLPKAAWLFLSRLRWYFGDDDYENKKKTVSRAKNVVKMLNEMNVKSILVVSHGFFMKCLVKELKSIGFKGHFSIYPEHGKLYVFEKHSI